MREQGAGIRGQGSRPAERPPKSWVPHLRGVLVFAAKVGNLETSLARFAGPALILLAAAVATAPQLIRGNSCGHDFDFHLVSWFDCLNAWRHGIVYPHWAPSANFGAGEPRFVFYPPLTWMLGAALGILLPWQFVPIALTFLLLAATGLATRTLAREALSDGAATLAGCAAIFSGYALFCAYERSAFGELTGGFWIPLLLLFALRERRLGGSAVQRALDGSAVPLALVVAGAWLSNAPVGVMACYLLAAVALTAALLGRSWAPVVRAAIGAALGLGLGAIYLIPAAWEQRWVDIRQATGDPGEMVENSWLFGRHADPALLDHDIELHRVSVLAVSMLAVALVGLLVAWWRAKLGRAGSGNPSGAKAPHGFEAFSARLKSCPVTKPCPDTKQCSSVVSRADGDFEASSARLKSCPVTKPCLETEQSSSLSRLPLRWWIPLALVPPAILFLLLPISLSLWNLLPKLRFLQFPWRWLVVLEAPMAIFFAAAVWPTASARRWRRCAVATVCTTLFLAATLFAARSFFQVCDDEDAVSGMVNAYRAGTGFAGVGEYSPVGADDSLLVSGLPAACLVATPDTPLGTPGSADGSIPIWTADSGSCEAIVSTAAGYPENPRFTATLGQQGYLVMRLRSFPAWQIAVNGRPMGPLPRRADGLMVVPVPKGPLDLSVDWITTPDALVGRWLSALALILLITQWWLERKLNRLGLS